MGVDYMDKKLMEIYAKSTLEDEVYEGIKKWYITAVNSTQRPQDIHQQVNDWNNNFFYKS